MNINRVQDLFQLQTELVDMKVDMAVNKAIDRVLAGFAHLEKRFTSVEHRLIAVETKLGMVNETEKEIRAKVYDTEKQFRNNIIDYTFRAGWLLLGIVLTYVLYQFHALIK